MLLLLLISLVASSKVQKILRPGAREVYYAILKPNDVELTIQLNQYTSLLVYYSITRPNEQSGDERSEQELNEPVNQKYTVPGDYRIEVYNADDENASINVYTNVMKSDEVDNDNLAIKNLFIDLEAKLNSLYNTNMRLKTIQEKNISEARKIRNGLYIMFAIPIMYVAIGFAKFHAIKLMFAPKKGLKI